MGRTCEDCGIKLPRFVPRRRRADGKLVCNGCHPDGKGRPGMPIGLHGTLVVEPNGDEWIREAAKLTFTHPRTQQKYTRSTDADYTHVSFKNGEIAWHNSADAAYRRSDEVYPLQLGTSRAGEEPCPQCKDEEVPGTITWQSATQGMQSSECSLCRGKGTVTRNAAGTIVHESKLVLRTASLNRPIVVVAHDGGEGEVIYHCPFCGGGNVVRRSDNSTECQFCQTQFTVQVQPKYPNMPQTINGQPADMPGMPGGVSAPGDAVPGQAQTDSPAAATPDAFQPPDAPAPAFEPPDDAQKAAKKRMYLTVNGVLDEDSFLRHLALKHADDRGLVLTQVRASRKEQS